MVHIDREKGWPRQFPDGASPGVVTREEVVYAHDRRENYGARDAAWARFMSLCDHETGEIRGIRGVHKPTRMRSNEQSQ